MAGCNNEPEHLHHPDEITYYKRPLDEQLISFSSKEGKQLFKESLEAGYMQNYFTLAEQFTT